MSNAQNNNDRLFWTTTHVDDGDQMGFYTCAEFKFQGFKSYKSYTLDLPESIKGLQGLNKEVWQGESCTGCFSSTQEARQAIMKVVETNRAWMQNVADIEYLMNCKA